MHPLPYCPEFYRAEFKSEVTRAARAHALRGRRTAPLLPWPYFTIVYSQVADLKNSVKDRGNAQSSCAGTFIGEHLHPEYQGGWLHCDMAGPAAAKERGTGYGVALVLALLEVDGFSA